MKIKTFLLPEINLKTWRLKIHKTILLTNILYERETLDVREIKGDESIWN